MSMASNKSKVRTSYIILWIWFSCTVCNLMVNVIRLDASGILIMTELVIAIALLINNENIKYGY